MKRNFFLTCIFALGTIGLSAQNKKADTTLIKNTKQSTYIFTHKDSLIMAEAIKNYQPPAPDPLEDMLPLPSRVFRLPAVNDVIDVGH